MKEKPIYTLVVNMEDIINNSGDEALIDYYNGLSEAQKDEFYELNRRGMENGFDYGLSDPLDDVMKVIASDLTLI